MWSKTAELYFATKLLMFDLKSAKELQLFQQYSNYS